MKSSIGSLLGLSFYPLSLVFLIYAFNENLHFSLLRLHLASLLPSVTPWVANGDDYIGHVSVVSL